MFATFSSPQCVKNIIRAFSQTVPRDARQGMAPANKTFHIFKAFQTFKNHKQAIPSFFQKQSCRQCFDAIVFCVFSRRAGLPVVQR